MTEQQLARMAKRRLAILRHAEEITGNVSLTCRYYGISRQVWRPWRLPTVAQHAGSRRSEPAHQVMSAYRLTRWSRPAA